MASVAFKNKLASHFDGIQKKSKRKAMVKSACAASGLSYTKRATKNKPFGHCRAKENYHRGGCTMEGPRGGKYKIRNGKKVYCKKGA